MNRKITKWLKLCLFLCLISLPCHIAAQNSNARQARHMFDQTYNMVFGAQGCTLHYDVNVIGLYKTNGTIWYKNHGKKSKFVEPSMTVWNDGATYTRVEPKKKLVTIFRADDPNRDKYASKFTFNPDNYNYSIASEKEGYVITLKAKKGVKGVKEAKALIDKKTRYPIHVRVKVAFFWTTINISNFHSGGISDDTFVFPRSKYADYKVVDNR